MAQRGNSSKDRLKGYAHLLRKIGGRINLTGNSYNSSTRERAKEHAQSIKGYGWKDIKVIKVHPNEFRVYGRKK